MEFTKELQYFNQLSNEQDLKFGDEYKKCKELVMDQSNKGRELIYNFIKNGEQYIINVLSTNNKQKQKQLSDMIFQILYFQQNIEISKKLFLEWDSEQLKQANTNTNENFYLHFANQMKNENKLQNSGAIEDLISILLYLKIGEANVEKSVKIIKICQRVIGQNLLKAKFIKSLKQSWWIETEWKRKMASQHIPSIII